jgi:hypothetical protein
VLPLWAPNKAPQCVDVAFVVEDDENTVQFPGATPFYKGVGVDEFLLLDPNLSLLSELLSL